MPERYIFLKGIHSIAHGNYRNLIKGVNHEERYYL